jgi:hypothetical protein
VVTSEVVTQSNQATETAESTIIIPVAVSAGVALLITLAVWRYQKNKQAQETLLQSNDGDFQALPDIVY